MSDPFIGEIKMVGFNFAPVGWAQCQGQLMTIAQNQALFALITTTYGGDGVQKFQLPDYQGRTPIGMGTGAGLAPVTQGQKAGVEKVTLTAAQMPSHNHAVTLQASGTPTNPLTGPTSTNNFLSASVGTGQPSAGIWSSQLKDPVPLAPVTASSALAGGSSPIDTRPPFIGTNFIIALEGLFPSRP